MSVILSEALTKCTFCNTNFANVDEDGLCDPCAQPVYEEVNTPRCDNCHINLEEHEVDNDDSLCSTCKVLYDCLAEQLAADLDRQWQPKPQISNRLIHKMMREK